MREILTEELKMDNFNIVFKKNPLPIWILDIEDLKFLAVNDAAVETYGYTQNEFMKMTLQDIELTDDSKQLVNKLKTIDGKIQRSTLRKHKTKNGKVIHVEIDFSKINYSGKVAGIVVVNDITGQEELINELIKSDTKYREFFDKVAVGIAEIDNNRTILKVNEKLSEILGYTESELQGKKFTDITHPDDVETGPYYFNKLLNNESGNYTYEKRYITKNEDIVWARVSTTRLTESSDSHPRFLSVIEDITEKKSDELQNNFLAAIVESSDDAIIGMNTKLEITSWNEAAERIFGYSPDEAIGQRNSFFHDTSVPDDDLVNVKKIKMGKRVNHYRTKRIHKDGHKIDVSITLSRIYDKNNKLIGFSKIIRDITQIISTENEIKNLLLKERNTRIEAERNHKRLQKLSEAGTILNSSLNYKKTLSNLAKLIVPEIADWCAVELLNKKGKLERVAVEHTDPDKVQFAFEVAKKYPNDPNDDNGVYKVIKTGETVVYENIPEEFLKKNTKSEEHFNLIKKLGIRSAIIVPLISRKKILGVILFINEKPIVDDMLLNKNFGDALAKRAAIAIDNAQLFEESRTLNKQLEERVKMRTVELEEANKELEKFSYYFSHDLRAPLRAINSYAGFMMEDYGHLLDDEGKRFLGVVTSRANQMGQLIDDLLTLSRTGRTSMNVTGINMKELALSTFNDLNYYETDRKIEFFIEDIPDIQGDHNLIRQVWQNLFSNAIKYTKNKDVAKIKVGFSREDGFVTYYVKDNGVGFNMKYVDKLFGVFQRLHKPADFEGNGVGLALVKRIIDRHGGKVKADAKSEEGAAFYFSLPEKEVAKNG